MRDLTGNKRLVAQGVAAGVLFAVIFLGVTTVHGSDCRAEVKAELHTTKTRADFDEWIFRIDARTIESCSRVKAVLEVRESVGAEERTRSVPVTIKVRSGEVKARKLTVRVDKGEKLTAWEFSVQSCSICGAAE